MSRVWRSVNDAPSVTTYCSVSTLVVSLVGKETSLSTPPATVNQTFDVRLRAVPTQSLRARSKCDSAPGPSLARGGGGAAPALAPPASSAMSTTAPANRRRPFIDHSPPRRPPCRLTHRTGANLPPADGAIGQPGAWPTYANLT